jgi:energy-coupling factor transporter transmembrane protein EcfT
MHKYVINDISMALKLSLSNFFILIIITGIFFLLGINFLDYKGYSNYKDWFKIGTIFFIILIFIQSIIIYFANRRYIIDLETGLVTFPRSDMENSIIAIILMFPYWNLMRTLNIHAHEIENIYLDTKRWTTNYQKTTGYSTTGKPKYKNETTRHIRYTINITGTFGSANLQFLSRQKRDEVRNAIEQCVKIHSNKSIDKKVAEFS